MRILVMSRGTGTRLLSCGAATLICAVTVPSTVCTPNIWSIGVKSAATVVRAPMANFRLGLPTGTDSGISASTFTRNGRSLLII